MDLPTVIFALVALLVAFKLRSVLGMRSGSQRPSGGLLAPLRRAPSASPSIAPAEAPPAPPAVASAPTDRWKEAAEPSAWPGLDAIAAADRSFAPQPFLSGARAAYDMVVHAFAAGDVATLRSLMAPEAFANFDAAIRTRAADRRTMTTTVVAIDAADIVAAELVGAMAQVSVRFASKLASATRDSSGAVVEGSPSEVADHVDVWTFARDVRSRDPNWQLTETQSER
ncbi:MAG: Tim44 domain-containing protein [Hyphomicrobiales bacterium]|nr:Tim44 domain-containing protein [Hyphomicrobiales bacterium]